MTVAVAKKARRTDTPASTRRSMATTEEVAAYLNISVPALIQLRYVGKAPKAVKVGTRLRWKWSDVDAWVDARSSTRPARD